MPPITRITKESIAEAALEICRRGGFELLNARAVAAELGCSTQPIFTSYSSMEELKAEVVGLAERMCESYVEGEVKRGEYPVYKASGMGYIAFAREESELFKILYMRDRTWDTRAQSTALWDKMMPVVKNNTGLDGDEGELFHLEMWVVVHGIAAMIASGYMDIDTELASRMLTDTYLGLKRHFEG